MLLEVIYHGKPDMGQRRKERARPSVAESTLLSREEWGEIVRELELTTRQAAIVELVIQAKKDKQIASILGISPWTIRSHLTRVFVRLHVEDRVELVVRVFGLCRKRERDGRS